MALTAAEKSKIRLFLGWSERFHQTDSRLEQALLAVDADATGETYNRINTLLQSIADIETRITDAYSRLKAIKVGSIELPGMMELGALRSEGRRFVGRLAALLGVAVRHDAFAAGGGHVFADATGSNYPPMG